MAIAFVDFVFTKTADSGAAGSPHAHARAIAVNDQISVLICSSGLNPITATGVTDDGGNTYTKQGTTVSVDGIRAELWTTIATQIATSISVAFTPNPANSTSVSVSSSRKTGVPAIGLVTSGSGSAAAASVTSPTTQDANNWIEFWVLDDQSNGGAGWTNAPSTGTRRSGTAIDAVNNVDHMMEDVDALIASAGGSITFSQTLNFNPGNYVIFALELRSTTAPPVGPTYIPAAEFPRDKRLFPTRPFSIQFNPMRPNIYPGAMATANIYTQDLLASLDSAGVLTNWTNKTLVGAIGPSGVLAKQITRALLGAVTFSGTLAKQLQRNLSGAIAPGGILARSKVTMVNVTGSLASAGALAKQTNKPLPGNVSFAGVLSKQTNKSLDGSSAPAGALAKQPRRGLSGATGPSGILIKQINKPLAGAVASSGIVSTIKLHVQVLLATLASTGVLSKQTQKMVGGSSAPSGVLTKQTLKPLTGTTGPGGSLSKRFNRALAGVVTSNGALAALRTRLLNLTGSLAPSGTVQRRKAQSVQGAIALSGAVQRRIQKALGGQMGLSGQLVRLINRALGANLQLSGQLTFITIARMFLELLVGTQGARYILGALNAVRYRLENRSESRYGPTYTGEASEDLNNTSSAKDDL